MSVNPINAVIVRDDFWGEVCPGNDGFEKLIDPGYRFNYDDDVLGSSAPEMPGIWGMFGNAKPFLAIYLNLLDI